MSERQGKKASSSSHANLGSFFTGTPSAPALELQQPERDTDARTKAAKARERLATAPQHRHLFLSLSFPQSWYPWHLLSYTHGRTLGGRGDRDRVAASVSERRESEREAARQREKGSSGRRTHQDGAGDQAFYWQTGDSEMWGERKGNRPSQRCLPHHLSPGQSEQASERQRKREEREERSKK